MPTVGDLHRVRRTLADSIGICPGTVACHDLNARMLSKPARERPGLPIGQQIHNTVPLQIDQDRSITMTAPPGPVIHRQHTRRVHRRSIRLV
jgi:hypothetical protein